MIVKLCICICVVVIALIIFKGISQNHFERKYNIYEPQKYRIFFGGVALEPLVLYASTEEIAKK